jgi:hypothetical protein
MNKIWLLIALFCNQSLWAQTKYTKQIDSLVKRIEGNESFYSNQDGNTLVQGTQLIGFTNTIFRYADSKGRNLILADEYNSTPNDSSLARYYFKKRQLVMVDAGVRIGGQVYRQQIYYRKRKLLYATPLSLNLFDPSVFLKRSKEYLAHKGEYYQPNGIVDRF